MLPLKPTDILLLTHTPLSAMDTVGNARYVQLAEQLDAAGFSVTLAVPNPEILPPTHFRVTASDAETLESLLRRHDTVISTSREYTARQISREDHLQIFDVADISFDEISRNEAGVQERIANILENANLILCGSPYQRDLWMGVAACRGALSPQAPYQHQPGEWMVVVPHGHPSYPPAPESAEAGAEPAAHSPADYVWLGGYDHLADLETALGAFVSLCQAGHEGNLLLPPPASAEESSGWEKAQHLVANLDARDSQRIQLAPESMTPRQQLAAMEQAKAGIISTRDSAASRFWSGAPISTAIWLRLPSVCSRGCFMSFLAEELEIGVCAAAGDVDDLAQKLSRVVDPAVQASLRANLQEVHSHFGWNQAIRPLLQFLERPPAMMERPVEQNSTWGRSVWRAVGRLFE